MPRGDALLSDAPVEIILFSSYFEKTIVSEIKVAF